MDNTLTARLKFYIHDVVNMSSGFQEYPAKKLYFIVLQFVM